MENDPEPLVVLFMKTHTHIIDTHRAEAGQWAKWGGDIKKRAFKLSPLQSVSIITDGIHLIQPTMLVSIASPPILVNTYTHTLIQILAEERV